MYKIYINETPLVLADQSELPNLPQPTEKVIVARYPGKSKYLLNYIDMLEKSGRYDAIYIYTDDFEHLKTDFNNLFKIIEAAGGVVYNNLEQILFIYRRGFWDLPKGKIDPGETEKVAAIREVQEETGLGKIELQEFIKATYHTYRSKKEKRILKKTFWFKMRTTESSLTPQTEEDIEKAEWINGKHFLENCRPVYSNVKSLIEELTT